MKSFDELFDEYFEAVYGGLEVPLVQRVEVKKAFAAGITAFLYENSDTKYSDEEAQGYPQKIWNEIVDFVDSQLPKKTPLMVITIPKNQKPN